MFGYLMVHNLHNSYPPAGEQVMLTRGIQSIESIIDDIRYQSISIDIN